MAAAKTEERTVVAWSTFVSSSTAGVERLMGFCPEAEYRTFLEQAPLFEEMLTKDDLQLIKF